MSSGFRFGNKKNFFYALILRADLEAVQHKLWSFPSALWCRLLHHGRVTKRHSKGCRRWPQFEQPDHCNTADRFHRACGGERYELVCRHAVQASAPVGMAKRFSKSQSRVVSCRVRGVPIWWCTFSSLIKKHIFDRMHKQLNRLWTLEYTVTLWGVILVCRHWWASRWRYTSDRSRLSYHTRSIFGWLLRSVDQNPVADASLVNYERLYLDSYHEE